MTPSKLGLLAAIGAIALCTVPACEPDTGDLTDFAGSGGGVPIGGTAGGGNTSQGEAGAGGEPASGSGGEAPAGGNTSGGESSTGGQTASGGSDLGGSSSGGQGGSGGDPSGQGGSDDPGAVWYCIASSNGCVCVQETFPSGSCGAFDCCYTYESGASGLACECNDAMGGACDNIVESNAGTRVDACPP